jgi:hypothetical protein
MKTLSLVLLVLRTLAGALVALVALVFALIEGTMLLRLDFVLFENELVALVQLVLKLLFATSALALGVFSLIKAERSFFAEGVALFAASAVMIPFVSNRFGLYFTAVSALFLLARGLWQGYGKKKE